MSHTPYNSNNNSQSLVGRTNVASGASFGGGGAGCTFAPTFFINAFFGLPTIKIPTHSSSEIVIIL